jgi:DNA-directed RNA polymerase subunit RPC12/RpoP
MTVTGIFECYKCGGLLLGTAKQETRRCPYCDTRVNLFKCKQIATAENAFQASKILRKLKTEKQDNARKPIR